MNGTLPSTLGTVGEGSLSPSILTLTTPLLSTISWMNLPFFPITLPTKFLGTCSKHRIGKCCQQQVETIYPHLVSCLRVLQHEPGLGDGLLALPHHLEGAPLQQLHVQDALDLPGVLDVGAVST